MNPAAWDLLGAEIAGMDGLDGGRAERTGDGNGPDSLTPARARGAGTGTAQPPAALPRPRRSGQTMSKVEREEAQRAFLVTFARTGNVLVSCVTANITRQTVYDWRRKYKTFGAEWDVAEDEAADVLEAEAWRRAMAGVEEPVVNNGRLVYEWEPVYNRDGTPKLRADGEPVYRRGKQITVRKYDTALTLALLRARRPEKFGNNGNGRGGYGGAGMGDGADGDGHTHLPPIVEVRLASGPPPEPVDSDERLIVDADPPTPGGGTGSSLPPVIARLRTVPPPEPDDPDRDELED